MKNIIGFLSVFFILGLAMMTMKPTDQECIYQLRDAGAGQVGYIINSMAYNRHTVRVEDHIFYKQIYSALDGQLLGTGIFGRVIKN